MKRIFKNEDVEFDGNNNQFIIVLVGTVLAAALFVLSLVLTANP